MSLLPCTSHRDPDHPFWASASGGGGGGGGPVIDYPGQSGGSTAMLSFNDSQTVYAIPFPSGIAVGDDFIFQTTLEIDDFDTDVGPPYSGLVEYIAVYNDDDRTWGVTNTTYLEATLGFPTVYAPVVLTLVGHRGENASDVNIIVRSKIQQTPFQILNLLMNGTTFTKIGTGYVPVPP